MYKRHTGQAPMLESAETYGSLPFDPNNGWIRQSKYVPWREFDLKVCRQLEKQERSESM